MFLSFILSDVSEIIGELSYLWYCVLPLAIQSLAGYQMFFVSSGNEWKVSTNQKAGKRITVSSHVFYSFRVKKKKKKNEEEEKLVRYRSLVFTRKP